MKEGRPLQSPPNPPQSQLQSSSSSTSSSSAVHLEPTCSRSLVDLPAVTSWFSPPPPPNTTPCNKLAPVPSKKTTAHVHLERELVGQRRSYTRKKTMDGRCGCFSLDSRQVSKVACPLPLSVQSKSPQATLADTSCPLSHVLGHCIKEGPEGQSFPTALKYNGNPNGRRLKASGSRGGLQVNWTICLFRGFYQFSFFFLWYGSTTLRECWDLGWFVCQQAASCVNGSQNVAFLWQKGLGFQVVPDADSRTLAF